VTLWAIALLGPLRTLVYEVALALTLAALLLPGIEWLSSRLPRAIAVALTVLGGLVAVVGVTVSSARDLNRQASALAGALSARLDTLDPESSLGRFAARSDLGDRTVRAIRAVPNRLVLGVDDPVEGARRLGQCVIVLVLALFALVSVPAMARAVVRLSGGGERSDQVTRTSWAAVSDASRFVLRNLGMGAVVGACAWATALLADLPGPVALGAWAGLLCIVPLFGVVVGLAPLVALSWSHSSTAGLLTLAVAIALAVGTRTVRHHWVQHPLRLGPLLTIVALAAGLRLAGPFGSLALLFFVAVGAAVLRECRHAGDLSQPASALDEFSRNVSDRSEERPSALLPLWRTHSDRTAAQLPVTVAWQSVAVTGALVVAVATAGFFVGRIPSVAIWTTLGIVLGLALNPVVNRLCELAHCGRSAGVALLGVGLLAVLVALTVLAVPPLLDAITSLPRDLPNTISRLERLPVVGAPLRRHDLGPAARQLIEELPDRLAEERPLTGMLGRAGDALLGVLWTTLIALAALLDGHRLLDQARRALPWYHRRTAERVADLAYRSFGRYAAGSALVAVANGTFVTVVALALGIPLAPLLGAWATVANFVPQIGGLIGGAPLVALGFNVSPARGMVALGAFLVYQNIENHVIQPVVIGKAIRLSPFSTMICVLGGGAVGGVVGALLATPIVGAVKLVACDVLETRRQQDAQRAGEHADGDASAGSGTATGTEPIGAGVPDRASGPTDERMEGDRQTGARDGGEDGRRAPVPHHGVETAADRVPRVAERHPPTEETDDRDRSAPPVRLPAG
jgi:predicted PurR-regulated permease PerM